MSNLYSLASIDWTKGLVVAVIVVVLGALQQAFQSHGLDVASFDWASILDVAVKAGVAYLAKNFLTDKKGRVLGKIG